MYEDVNGLYARTAKCFHGLCFIQDAMLPEHLKKNLENIVTIFKQIQVSKALVYPLAAK